MLIREQFTVSATLRSNEQMKSILFTVMLCLESGKRIL